jgi:hypothetical protein
MIADLKISQKREYSFFQNQINGQIFEEHQAVHKSLCMGLTNYPIEMLASNQYSETGANSKARKTPGIKRNILWQLM